MFCIATLYRTPSVRPTPYRCPITRPPLIRPFVRAVARAPSAAPTRHRRSESPLHCLASAKASTPARRPWAPSPPPRCRPAGRPPRPPLGNGSRRGPARAAPPPLPRPASRSATNSAQATCTLGPHGLVPQDGVVAFSEVSETTLLLSREHAPPPAAPARQGRARSEPLPLARGDSNTRVAVSRSSTQRTDPDHEPKPLVRESSMGFLPRVGAGVLILPSVSRASKTRKTDQQICTTSTLPVSNLQPYYYLLRSLPLGFGQAVAPCPAAEHLSNSCRSERPVAVGTSPIIMLRVRLPSRHRRRLHSSAL